MKVAALMSKNTISVLPTTTIADVARIMLANRVTGLPVLDTEGRLVGVVSEGDLLRRAELGTEGKHPGWLKALLMPASAASDYVTTHSRHVSGVMTRDPVFVTPETELAEAVQLMLRKHIKRLPVLENGVLAGVISRTDLLRLLARKLIETSAETSDAAISDYIKSELDHALWAPKSGVRIEVKDKIVSLEGTIFSNEAHHGIMVIAENAPGVKSVTDHLTFIDPGSGIAFQTGL